MTRAMASMAATALVIGGLAWGAAATNQTDRASDCNNRADHLRHLERSRNGVSLSCDPSRFITLDDPSRGDR